MRYEVIVQPAAEDELEGTYRHIWKDSPERAARWRQRLLAKAESLNRSPAASLRNLPHPVHDS